MLTNIERERLENRGSIDSATRARNELIVRNKLEKWLNDSLDADIIMDHLPEKQIKKLLTDGHAFILLSVAIKTMSLLDFRPVEGNITNPDSWHITTEEIDRESEERKFNTRPATDIDIARSILMDCYLDEINGFVSKSDPAVYAWILSRRENHPGNDRKIKEEERMAINRVNVANENYSPGSCPKH
jgi:hypothetical protein